MFLQDQIIVIVSSKLSVFIFLFFSIVAKEYIYIYIYIYILPTTTITIILCFCYCSPNRTDFSTFFEYITTSHEKVTSSCPNIEVLYLGDFNVHNTEWLGSSHTDTRGRGGGQIIQHSQRSGAAD